jgi:predicted RecB family nuclease
MDKAKAIKSFQIIPGVGPSIAADLWKIGIRSLDDLKEKDPQKLYDKLCQLEKKHIDRCVLYVFRLAVYFAIEPSHDPYLLKWWRWKDKD